MGIGRRTSDGVRRTCHQVINQVLRPEYAKKLWAGVFSLAEQHLDMHQSVKEQPKEWDRFIGAATKKFPIFRAFEDVWPLREYTTQRLRKYRSRMMKATEQGNITERDLPKQYQDAPPPGEEMAADLHRATEPPSNMTTGTEIGNTFKTLFNGNVRLQPYGACEMYAEMLIEHGHQAPHSPVFSASWRASSHELPPRAATADPSALPTSDIVSPTSELTKALAISPAPLDPRQHVGAFLASLCPPLPHMLPIFTRAGICNERCLQAMAAWSPARIDDFLRKMVDRRDLSALEAEAIACGLREISQRAV
ncbi:hypothetical protein OE88DRAFT_1669547 [Heliocybe sulcata]|uniref:Uncharacterized protein n=1 Tax=Heliocybe sulcata TaxID=5364 RepID=A0A5C3MIR4_9AGAM|nr:hypothetical protein OE88DRAFT_1669547 [Heliocybe sulcata]